MGLVVMSLRKCQGKWKGILLCSSRELHNGDMNLVGCKACCVHSQSAPAHPQVHKHPQCQKDQREIISELEIKLGLCSACASESWMLLFVRMRAMISFNELNLENSPYCSWLKCDLSVEGMRIFCLFAGFFPT